MNMEPATLAQLLRAARARTSEAVFVIAIDGRSGAGKSTLARTLASHLDSALVIDGDDFYAGGVELRTDSPRERAEACIDWREQARVLTDLRAGRTASYHAFDWDHFDGTRQVKPTIVQPNSFVLLEGVYSARPELANLVDLRIRLRIDDETRRARLVAREGTIGPWEEQWHEAELWYFNEPPRFDLEL